MTGSKEKISKKMLMGHEHNTASPKRKRLRLSQVSAETRVKIVKMAVKKMHTHKEIGELFNVRPTVVAQLASALKRSKPIIVKRREKELRKSHDQAAIILVVRGLISKHCSVWTVK